MTSAKFMRYHRAFTRLSLKNAMIATVTIRDTPGTITYSLLAGGFLPMYTMEKNSNFSKFRTYREDKAKHKLEEIVEMVEKRSMPLKTFVMMHPETEITPQDEKAIHSWISTLLKTED